MTAALNFGLGFGTGYESALSRNKEQEVVQGKNYYFASLCQIPQFVSLSMAVTKIFETAMQNSFLTRVEKITGWLPWVQLPVGLIAASVIHGDYESYAASLAPPGSLLERIVPRNLSGRAVRICTFINRHTGDVAQIATVVAGVALVALGQLAFGYALLGSLAYREFDIRGNVPRKLSLFIETYMPIISLGAYIIQGGLVVKAICSIQLATYFTPVQTFVSQKMDRLFHDLFDSAGYSLEEYEAPLRTRKQMNYQSVVSILRKDDQDFKLNAAHCSKWAASFAPIAQDYRFDDLLPLFDGVNWEANYQLVRPKLKDDEIFIDLLKEKFPNVDVKLQFDSCIASVARANHMTIEEYSAHWIRSQLKILISVLKGEKRAKGLQADLNVAISHVATVLSYLKSCPNRLEKEEILLKLAVECGDYCARGAKRGAGEIVNDQIIPSAPLQGGSNPHEQYEITLRQSLQNCRHRQIEKQFEKLKRNLQNLPSAVTQDVHAFDMYRKILSYGFYPMTEDDRRELLILEQMYAHTLYDNFRSSMIHGYRDELDDVVKGIGEMKFSSYFQYILNQNPNLTRAQKDEILELYTEADGGNWTIDETNSRFHRLVLVMLGVLEPR
jgi:hypothetical protein